MIFLNYIHKKSIVILAGIALLCLLDSCGIYKPVDARKVPASADERVKRNLEEGKGFCRQGLQVLINVQHMACKKLINTLVF